MKWVDETFFDKIGYHFMRKKEREKGQKRFEESIDGYLKYIKGNIKRCGTKETKNNDKNIFMLNIAKRYS